MKCISRMSVWSHGLMAGSLLLSLHALGADKVWTGTGAGLQWGDGANWDPVGAPGNGDVAIFNAVGGTVNVTDNRTIQQIRVNSTADVEINIFNGMTFAVANNGSQGIQAYTADLTINGPGKLALSVAGTGANDVNHLDNGANLGRTLTINAQIVALDGGNTTGFETWVVNSAKGGTVALTNPNNAFTLNFNAGNGHVVVAPTLSNIGSPSSVGDFTAFLAARGSILRYTGTTAASTDRQFRLNGGDATLGYGGGIEHAGSGVLTWSGDIYNANNSAQTLQLLGDSIDAGIVTGNIYNNQNSLSVVKSGSGTWVLTGNNSFTGGLTVNAGTLGLGSATAAGNVAQITMAAGTTLAINPLAMDDFSITVPPVVASGGSISITVTKAPANSSVTFSALTATSVNIDTADAGTAANRIFITGLATGVVGPWLTINGGTAQYDTSTGLTPKTITGSDFATKGNLDPLPNDNGIQVIINAPGTGDDIQLDANPTELYSITQAEPSDYATVNTAGKTLMVAEAAIESGANALNIGANPQDGKLLPPLQLMAVADPIIPPNNPIPALNPMIWYDPSDAATVRFYADAVSGLVNKGTNGPSHDAVVRGGWTGPIYATGNESHSALPMLKSAINGQGLQSLSNTGISGKMPRTLIAVVSRASGNTTSIVSIGEGTSGKAFETFLRYDCHRFGTYSGDINLGSTSPIETPVVMTFFNGVDADNESFRGFADGVIAGTQKRTDLNTSNTPLHLMSRNGASDNGYRGQIGEVLFFDYTLSDGDRELVEAYLMTKWKQAKAAMPAQSATITLRNDSTVAPLTVNAAIDGPDGSTIGLVKSGNGNVVLAGGAQLRGAVSISGGTLTVNTPDGLNDILSGITSGAGKLVKDGAGTLTLPSTAVNQYLGGTDILGGTLLIGHSRALGTGLIDIQNGGTLDIGGGLVNEGITITNAITVAGAGANGEGAIVNNGVVQQRNAFQNSTIKLLANATFGGSNLLRWDLSGMGQTLDLNGNTLTKTGVTDFRISPAIVTNAPAGTAFNIEQGVLGIESQTILAPNDSAREIAISAGARFGVYNTATPVNWTIRPADGAEIWAYGNTEATNANVLASDITLPAGTLYLTSSGSFSKNFTGKLTGAGGLCLTNGGMRAMSLLSNPANDFTGPVGVTNAVLGLLTPDCLPSLGQLALARNNSGVRVFMGGATGWTGAEVKSLAENGQFNSTTLDGQRLQINVGTNESASLPAFSSAFVGGIDKFGGGTLSFDEATTLSHGSVRTYAGGLVFTNSVIFNAYTNHLYLGDAAANDGTGAICSGNVIGGDAVYTSDDRGYAIAGPAIYVAARNATAVLDVKDNAQVQANMFLGGSADSDTSAVGAVYQAGNSEWLSTGGAYNDAIIGNYGYGYYQLDSGTLTLKGWTNLGKRSGASSIGILRQKGGTLSFNGTRYAISPNGEIGDSYAGCIDMSRGGVAVIHLEGGTFEHYGEIRILNESDNSANNGTAILTVTGTADAMFSQQIYMGHRNNGTAILNINNGGKVTAPNILRKDRASSTVSVNFNGGTFSVTNNAGNQNLFARESSRPMSVNVFEGGATIDLSANVTRIIDIPVTHPEGAGIIGIPVNAGGIGYIAPPNVTITGGGGSGATAIANINRVTGALTDIEITCPGKGYTSAPTVTLSGGGGKDATLGAATFGRNSDGGLTKTGDGTLILSAANTYRGPTRVNGGTLLLRHPQAIHPNAAIIIGDGTLDLGGHTISNVSVTLTGNGGIANGKIVTTSVTKEGENTAGILDAAIEFAAVDTGRVPGLWEGNIKGTGSDYWNLNMPNPKNTIQLTTRAGNIPSPTIVNSTGVAAPFWSGNYNMWIYTGYVWNRSATNETWSWRGVFDDYVNLTIDGIQLFNVNGNNVTVRNYTMTPGAHPIEIRFGDGTGNVGAYSGASGLLYDPLGRSSSNAADYRTLTDNGSGDLLTATASKVEPKDKFINVESGTLLLPTPEAGLWEGWLPDGRASTAPNPKTSVELTTTAANGYAAGVSTQTDPTPYYLNGKIWTNYTAYVYTGYIWNRAATNETWTFAENFDDDVRLIIDGTPVLDDTAWATATLGTITLTPGAHAFEVRFGQGTGGTGCPNPGDATVAANSGWWGEFSRALSFAVDFSGRHEPVAANYKKLEDLGDGHILTLTPFGTGEDVLAGTTINVSSNATLDLGGIPRDGITIIGAGLVTNGVAGSSFIISPAGDNATGYMAVDSLSSLDGVTYKLTIHTPDHYTNTPGLWEAGPLPGALNLIDANPKTNIAPSTVAANGFVNAVNLPINDKHWPGNSTYVYTGYIWNNTGTNTTWTFAKSFDDSVWMSIDGEVYINHTTHNQIFTTNVTLTTGPHAFEIRFGQGTGGVGAVSQSWWTSSTMSFGVDFQGRGENILANYVPLANPAEGPYLLTTTARLYNGIGCDVITSGSKLNLTGLTIKPSDDASVSPVGNNYVIAISPNGFEGTPKLEGFEGKNWKTLRKGNELLLTTQGGTLMILK